MPLTMTMSLPEFDIGHLQRLTIGTEKGTRGMHRAFRRYIEIMENIPPPPTKVVRQLYEILINRYYHVLWSRGYPDQAVVQLAVEKSTASDDERVALLSYLGSITFPEYAKLIEAVEMMAAVRGKPQEA